MVSLAAPERCASCRRVLPPVTAKHPRKWRHVPSRRGALLPVCDECADTIDLQGRLSLPGGGPVGANTRAGL